MTIALQSVHKKTRSWKHFTQRQLRRGAYYAKPRLYIDVERETMLENLAFRRSRPITLYRKLLPQVLKLLGLPSSAKVVWSQKAGCSCGCSPGFIVQTTSTGTYWDAWVSVYGADAQISTDPEKVALADMRA